MSFSLFLINLAFLHCEDITYITAQRLLVILLIVFYVVCVVDVSKANVSKTNGIYETT